jgi:hypothetical protein
MEKMISQCDGGKQVRDLLKKHFEKYRYYSENVTRNEI